MTFKLTNRRFKEISEQKSICEFCTDGHNESSCIECFKRDPSKGATCAELTAYHARIKELAELQLSNRLIELPSCAIGDLVYVDRPAVPCEQLREGIEGDVPFIVIAHNITRNGFRLKLRSLEGTMKGKTIYLTPSISEVGKTVFLSKHVEGAEQNVKNANEEIIHGDVVPSDGMEGARYSLYCKTCDSWVPNNACHESKKRRILFS